MSANRQQFDHDLDKLKDALVNMGKTVEQAIMDSVKSLKESDIGLARQIVENDDKINKMEEEIDEIGSTLIATQQPVAKDLRKILISFRVASDLERMGDLAVDIAKVTIRMNNEDLLKPLVDIPRMAEIVQLMMNESLSALIHESPDLAYKMAKIDDEVDHLYSQILRELFVFMVENPKTINQCMPLCFVAHHLERMADHATNIGEDTVFLVKGDRPDLNQ